MDFYHPILDAGAPELNCSDLLYSTDSGLSTASSVTINPAVTDNVDQYPTVVCSHSSQDVFELGHTLVTCNATDDSGNIDFCYFNVTVRGMLIEFSRLHTQYLHMYMQIPSQCFSRRKLCFSITRIHLHFMIVFFQCNPFYKTVSSIKCKVFVSFLSDNEPPVCPYDMTVDTDEGSDGAYVDFSEELQDNVDQNPSISCSPGPAYLVGSTRLSCRVSDSSGNVQNCQFNLTVRGKFRISIEFRLL